MDSGTLYFIIVVEALVIVWLLSKLKQFRKFEHLLSPTSAPESQPAVTLQPEDAAEASLQRAPGVQSLDAEGSDDELLGTPGADPEANIEEAKRVQLVMARCHYAEFYLEQLDDDYERDQFKRIVKSCIATANSIDDPFFRSSALHPLVLLLDRAEWHDRRDQLMSDVQDDIVRDRIAADLKSQTSA